MLFKINDLYYKFNYNVQLIYLFIKNTIQFILFSILLSSLSFYFLVSIKNRLINILRKLVLTLIYNK